MKLTTKIFYGPNVYSKTPIVLVTVSMDPISIEQNIQICGKMEKLFSNYIDKDFVNITAPNLYFGN